MANDWREARIIIDAHFRDPALLEEIARCVRDGMSIRATCNYLNINRRAFENWLAQAYRIERRALDGDREPEGLEVYHLDFLRSFRKARGEFVQRHLGVVSKAALDEGDRHAASWLLERGAPDDFAASAARAIGAASAEDGESETVDDVSPIVNAMEATLRGIPAPPGLLPEAWTPYRYVPSQMELLSNDTRFVGLQCGRGSGKTDIALRRLVIALAARKEWPTPMYFYAAPTNHQAIRIAWEPLGKLIPKAWLRKVHRSEQFYETRFDSRLYVLGMDKPERIEGNQWDGGIIDESADQKPGAFDRSIRPTLGHRHGWAWRIGVPKRTGICSAEFNKWCEQAETGDYPDRAFFTWRSADIMPADEIDTARHDLSPEDFREQYEATRESRSGLIFSAFDRAHNVAQVAYNPEHPICIGCDFNVSPMAWMIGHRYEDGLHIFDELYERDTNTEKCKDIIWNRYSAHKGGFEWYGDASGHARKTSSTFTDWAIIMNDSRFRAAGVRHFGFKSAPPLKSRFAATNAMLCNAAGVRRCIISPNCENLIRDLETRAYKQGTSIPLDPSGTDMGHATDGLGYIIWHRWPISIKLELDICEDDIIMLDSDG